MKKIYLSNQMPRLLRVLTMDENLIAVHLLHRIPYAAKTSARCPSAAPLAHMAPCLYPVADLCRVQKIPDLVHPAHIRTDPYALRIPKSQHNCRSFPQATNYYSNTASYFKYQAYMFSIFLNLCSFSMVFPHYTVFANFLVSK